MITNPQHGAELYSTLMPGIIHVALVDYPTHAHDIGDPADYSWYLPVLGPTAHAVLPRLLAVGRITTNRPIIATADLAFMCGIAVPQLKKGLERLQRFNCLAFTDMSALDTRALSMPNRLPRVPHAAQKYWPQWFIDEYDKAMPL